MAHSWSPPDSIPSQRVLDLAREVSREIGEPLLRGFPAAVAEV